MGIFGAGSQPLASLTGAELVEVDNGGATKVTATTAQIAALAAANASIVNTAITTAGNGTLTAAGLVGGLITRTGPSGAYSDTVATAALIVAALPEFLVGDQFIVRIKNATPYLQTLVTATGVTLPTTVIIGPFQEGVYYATVGGTAASPTVTLAHLLTTPIALATGAGSPVNTALATVGAGTITAPGINGAVTIRGGAQSNTAFTDTTDTAAAIIAGNPGLVGKIGAAFLYLYRNNTDANATLAGGTGVTVSGITVVPGGTSALYLVTYTATATVTMVGVLQTAPAAASGTFVANGATPVSVADTRITANSVVAFGMKTAGGTPSAPFMVTVTPGTGFTVAAAASNTTTYNYTILG